MLKYRSEPLTGSEERQGEDGVIEIIGVVAKVPFSGSLVSFGHKLASLIT
jgi:hypothetical protein